MSYIRKKKNIKKNCVIIDLIYDISEITYSTDQNYITI